MGLGMNASVGMALHLRPGYIFAHYAVFTQRAESLFCGHGFLYPAAGTSLGKPQYPYAAAEP